MRRGLTVEKIREQQRAYRVYHKRWEKAEKKPDKVARMVELAGKVCRSK